MNTLERSSEACAADTWREHPTRDGIPCLAVQPERLHDLMRDLRDSAGFECSIFVTAIDRFPHSPRFELRYGLLSVSHKDRLHVMTTVDEGQAVPTITDLWPGASFSERECYDMFGVQFEGHPDLRRLLMPEGYEYHPLRKDFPHQGIEPDRLYREWERGRRD